MLGGACIKGERWEEGLEGVRKRKERKGKGEKSRGCMDTHVVCVKMCNRRE